MTISTESSEWQPVPDGVRYRLTLYVSAGSELSRRAVMGAKTFCERVLPGRYDLQVLDLETHASNATAHGVLATPTLMVTEPLPPRRYVGDLSDVGRVAQALGLALPTRPHDARSGD
jgi:circadian clock protein KaiB